MGPTPDAIMRHLIRWSILGDPDLLEISISVHAGNFYFSTWPKVHEEFPIWKLKVLTVLVLGPLGLFTLLQTQRVARS